MAIVAVRLLVEHNVMRELIQKLMIDCVTDCKSFMALVAYHNTPSGEVRARHKDRQSDQGKEQSQFAELGAINRRRPSDG
jgi:hypothetical protein